MRGLCACGRAPVSTCRELSTDLEADVDGVAKGVHTGLGLRLGGAGEVLELARHHLLALERGEVVLEGEALVVHLWVGDSG